MGSSPTFDLNRETSVDHRLVVTTTQAASDSNLIDTRYYVALIREVISYARKINCPWTKLGVKL